MIASPKHIVFVHLLNDFSGSPLVLSQVIQSIPGSRCSKTLFTSRSAREGFLSDLPDVKTRYFWYRWMSNPWARLFTFTLSQCILFFSLLRYWRKDVTIYVNTLLPFGAALAASLMGKTVVYHIHETSMKPLLLKRFLRAVANRTASRVIYVSKYLAETEKMERPENITVYNRLPGQFVGNASRPPWQPSHNGPFTVLMICSLKKYKGVDEFVALARSLPDLGFELVLNATAADVQTYFEKQPLPSNLSLFDARKDVHPFYRRASLLLNLSHPDKWIETFGMTVLEGMYYGLPVIVPPVGGVTELVDDGKNGFYADSRDQQEVIGYIRLLAANRSLYRCMSEAASRKAREFTGSVLIDENALPVSV